MDCCSVRKPLRMFEMAFSIVKEAGDKCLFPADSDSDSTGSGK
ncbi:hypothetical protein RINTHH_19620 [Richelia intracellularis HH01]|uniref:Uncharacterized protein n=1 Tax=Richelia intracellularis HH01 TaxID=1165094 RepID=M1X055_9NOST|nr:hypothetical protein RINTHH_19620 [Richelia intracellularis HH01]